jgi:hypothetical protein
MKNNDSSKYIDLGESLKPLEMTFSDPIAEKVHYPTLYFSGKNELKALPQNGEATIYYKKVMERTEKITRDGKTETRYVVELEIHGIEPEKADEMENEATSDEDAIEEGLEEASNETEEEEED